MLIAPLLVAQSDTPLTGVVTNQDGQPLAGVSVSSRTTCCPQKVDRGETDKDGRFRLEHPGKILHFYKEGTELKTVVVSDAAAEVHITLEPPSDSMIAPKCKDVPKRIRRISWGKYGAHFDVPEQKAKVLGGKPDVDYVMYLIRPVKGGGSLQFWFGPYAMDSEPDDEQFLDSSTFTQRYVVNPKGEPVGEDNWGRSKSGGNWRRTAVFISGGATYKDANAQDAALFDQIINSVCVTPFPGQ
jgi:hypothetical protein